MIDDFSNLDNRVIKALKGTTTVGVVCKDGVVLATDRRATAGYFVASKRAQKIFPLDQHIAATIAGRVADAQTIMDYARAEINLYRLQEGIPIRIHSAARMVANILFNARYFPYLLQSIVAGVDDLGPKMFNLDPFGSLTEETYLSTGSGAPIAYGILENNYKEDIPLKDGLPLAVASVWSAIARDAGTGNGVNAATVTHEEGVRELTEEEIAKIPQKLS
ncbi:MAG: archaeal proteasome endopeptidase complex subunit beta [Candidatus Heimdallarchaeota archaeon]